MELVGGPLLMSRRGLSGYNTQILTMNHFLASFGNLQNESLTCKDPFFRFQKEDVHCNRYKGLFFLAQYVFNGCQITLPGLSHFCLLYSVF